MISQLVHGAHRLDAWLKLNVGRPYTFILSVGLVIAMVNGVRWRNGPALEPRALR